MYIYCLRFAHPAGPIVCWLVGSVGGDNRRKVSCFLYFCLPFWYTFGGPLGALWGWVGSPVGVLEANPTHRRPEGPSRTPQDLLTPIVYNPHFTLQPSLLLREFYDFSVYAKNSHFESTNFAWDVCRIRPYLKSTGATKKAPESTEGSHWKSEVEKSPMYGFT